MSNKEAGKKLDKIIESYNKINALLNGLTVKDTLKKAA